MESFNWRDTLVLPCDEGFEVVEDDMKDALSILPVADTDVLWDRTRHILISMADKTINGFSARLLNAKDIAKKDEGYMRSIMKTFGYKLEGFTELPVGSKFAQGFEYTYLAKGDVPMTAITCVVKEGKTLYYFHIYFRTAERDESLACVRKIFDNAEWI
ncbi:MAG: hypothetical protein II510_01210 [Erysipelotrichales bacterium]|nr:hypothetical protein [Erysipelotrichales bacterium]